MRFKRFLKISFSSLIIFTMIGVNFFFAPRVVHADVFDTVASVPCTVYLKTVGKLVDALEDYATSIFTSSVKDGVNAVVNKAKDSLKEEGESVLTGAVPVTDSQVQQKVTEASEDNATAQNEQVRAISKYEECKEMVRRTMLSVLKKNILDVMVNDIVEWIQTGETFGDLGARFTQSWEGTLENVKQEAIGGLAEDLGLGFLCKPFSFQVQLQFAKPQKFARRAACTLDTMTNNIEKFGRDFNSGGWFSYREVMKPQNNFWGAQILAQDEVIQRINDKQVAKKKEMQAGFGFTDQKICTRWKSNYSDVAVGKQKEDFVTPNESSTPSEGIGVIWKDDYYKKSPGNDGYTGTWTCVNEESITQGRVVGEAATKAVGHDFDFIINADDLADYLTAISDAVINRITKESISGLAGLYDSAKGSSARGSDVGSQNYYNNSSHTGLRDRGNEYSSITISQQQSQTQQITFNNIQNQIENASTTLPIVKTNYTNAQSKNEGLIVLLSNPLTTTPPGLIACYEQVNIVNPPPSASSSLVSPLLVQASSTLLTASSLWRAEIAQKITDVNGFDAERLTIKTALVGLTPQSDPTVLNSLKTRADTLTTNITAYGLDSLSILSRQKTAYTQKLGEQTLYAPWCQ